MLELAFALSMAAVSAAPNIRPLASPPPSASRADAPAEIVALAEAGATAIAEDDFGRVFRSSNGGTTWTLSTHGLPPPTAPASALGILALAPDGLRAYVVRKLAQGRSILYRSDDAGESWYARKDLDQAEFTALSLDGAALHLSGADGASLDII